MCLAPVAQEVDAPLDASKRLLPFGGTRDQGSHKAYGLMCMIDIMSNCLSGVGPGCVTGGGGSVFTAHNIEAFTDMVRYTHCLVLNGLACLVARCV